MKPYAAYRNVRFSAILLAVFTALVQRVDAQTCPPTGLACPARGSAACPQGAQTFDGCHFVRPSNSHRGFVSQVTRQYYVVDNVTNCPINCEFTLEIRAVENSGGHCHTVGTRPTGIPAAGKYPYPGPVTITHTLPEFSGPIVVIALPGSNCPGSATLNAYYLCVMEPDATCSAGLTTLVAEPGFINVPGVLGADHGDARYVDATTRERFAQMLFSFHSMDGGAILQVADRSLIWGGAIDRVGEWISDFYLRGHRTGASFDLKFLDDQGGPLISLDDFRKLYVAMGASGLLLRYEDTTILPGYDYLHIYQEGVGTTFGEDD